MIKFDLLIYSSQAIQAAINDYRNIADIEAEFENDICICYIHSSVYDSELTKKEFSNYVLEKTVSRGLQP